MEVWLISLDVDIQLKTRNTGWWWAISHTLDRKQLVFSSCFNTPAAGKPEQIRSTEILGKTCFTVFPGSAQNLTK